MGQLPREPRRGHQDRKLVSENALQPAKTASDSAFKATAMTVTLVLQVSEQLPMPTYFFFFPPGEKRPPFLQGFWADAVIQQKKAALPP